MWLKNYELQRELIQFSNDGIMQQVDEIEYKYDLQHLMIYMQDGAVNQDIHTLEINVY